MSGRVRRRNPLRALLGAILVLALLLVAALVTAGLVAQRRLDPVALTARIEADVLRQTGRRLSLSGLQVRLLPVPTVQADEVAFANWPQGGPPRMLTAARVQAHLALLPLLRDVVRLEGVTLTRPDIVLERAADGRVNWQMRKPVQPEGGAGGGGAHWRVEVGSVRLLDGRIAWTDAHDGWSGAVDRVRLEASGLAGDGPSASLSGRHGNAGFQASVATGALSRLEPGDPSRARWRLRIDASEQLDGHVVGRIGIAGTLTDPARLRGYDLDVDAQAMRLEALDSLFPHAALPPVADVMLHTHLADAAPAGAAAGQPQISRLDLRSGAFEARRLPHAQRAQGLAVDRLSLQAAARTAPVAITLAGRWRDQPVTLTGTMGTLASWSGANRAGWGPVRLALELTVGAAHVELEGDAGTASNLRVRVSAPALRPLVADGPDLTELAASARVQIQAPTAVTVSELRLESRELGLTGSATLLGSTHPTLTAALAVEHADLDALRAGWRAEAGAPAATPKSEPGPTAPATGEAVPFAALRLADLAVRINGRQLRLGGADYRDLVAELAVHDGTLTLAPFSLDGPAGPIAGSLAANAADRSLTLIARPSMLQARALASLLGLPPSAEGVVELVADLTATGGSTDALLASLTGRAGLSMVDGSVANATLVRLLGRSIAPDGGGGRTAFRCMALPARVAGGVATVAPLLLQTARLDVQGHGTVVLADGRLDLHLLPRVLIGGAGASMPVHLGGTLEAPEAGLDPAAPGGRFALTIGPGAPAADLCGPALAAARFGAAGPMPRPDVAAAHPRKGPKALDILRGLGLFR